MVGFNIYFLDERKLLPDEYMKEYREAVNFHNLTLKKNNYLTKPENIQAMNNTLEKIISYLENTYKD